MDSKNKLSHAEIHKYMQERFKQAIDNDCKNSGCQLKISDIDKKLITIINCDRFANIIKYTGKICDFFIFLTLGNSCLAIVEMKSKNIEPLKAIKQLQEGVSKVDDIITWNIPVSYYPILLHKGGMHPNDYKILGKERITIKGNRMFIIVEKCGSYLSKIISI
jgi:hypothetical protein